jgi:hypothetical protein
MEIKLRKSIVYPFLAWVFAALVSKALMLLLTPYLNQLASQIPNLEEDTYLLSGISGLLMALTQWAVLRNYLKRGDLWGLITFSGVAANALLMNWLSPTMENFFRSVPNPTQTLLLLYFALVQGLQGVFLGLFQWIALRMEVGRAWHWIWGVALGSILSTLVNYGLLEILLARVDAANITSSQLIPISLATTASNAIITGSVLVWLLQNPLGVDEEEAEQEMELEDA